ncbi:MAG: TetR/AcrR family transcriptional regulator [Myxococcota bacterium]
MPNQIDRQTADKLLVAAEEAFAKSGIDRVSVRQINHLAGQRNTSAVRYHFGSKEGLLEALIEQRMGEVEEERASALEVLDATSSPMSVEDLIRVLVEPLASRVCREPSWGCWVRVLSQLLSIRGDAYQSIWQHEHDQTSREIFRRLRKKLSHLPKLVWQQRAADLRIWSTSSLCERARLLESGARPPLGRQAYIVNLVTTLSHALSA